MRNTIKPLSSVMMGFSNYAGRLGSFRPNARLYLAFVVLSGAAFGIFRLLLNFYVLSLGYDQSLLGHLITINSASALLTALPIGYLGDYLGRKRSLILGSFVVTSSIMLMILFPVVGVFYGMNVIFGMAQSLMAVTTAPFLAENSGEEERTYLFSFSFGLQTLAGFVGNLVGGYLPGWFGVWQSVSETSSTAYAWALAFSAFLSVFALIPLFFLKRNYLGVEVEKSAFAPLSYFVGHYRLLGKLILPMFITSIGAGMIMPFMNVFFRIVYNQPDPVIGNLFAWGALAMGIGLLVAPVFAERMGSIRFVVVTQAISIPFLILLGFSPWFWLSAVAFYIRMALMNMSNPIYQAFVMEQVEPESRATVASLVSMSWNFGWAVSPTVSGMLQVTYGFGPPFIITILTYCLAVFFYWAFFLREKTKPVQVGV